MGLTELEAKYFKSEADRDLYLKLDAERQITWEKSLTYYDKVSETHKPTRQAIHHRSMETALEIARRGLDYDMSHPEVHGGLRNTLEDLLLMSPEQLSNKRDKHFQEYWAPKLGPLK